MEPLRFRVARKAQRDVAEAVEYYEIQRLGLGEAFDEEVTQTIQRICRMPTTGSSISVNARICKTHRFPYGVIYRRQHDQIVVVSVKHLHGDPDNWTRQLDET